MQGSFNLGIYTSASPRTVAQVRAMLEAAAGPGLPLFTQPNLILYRMHTIAATAEHLAGGGKEWDTRKPLRRYFSRLWRVLLVDDDAFKVCCLLTFMIIGGPVVRVAAALCSTLAWLYTETCRRMGFVNPDCASLLGTLLSPLSLAA